MKLLFVFVLLSSFGYTYSQPKVSNSEASNPIYSAYTDSLIKDTLIKLTLINPTIKEFDGLLGVEKYGLKKAKASWMDAFVVQANINEFVINQTENSAFWPKYNFGLLVPMGYFGRNSAEVNISKNRIKVAEARKEIQLRALKREVLTRYEDYKEKRLLLELQQALAQDQNTKYLQVQKDYSNGRSDLGKVNEEYQNYLRELLTQRSRERDLNVAILQLEELIVAEVQVVINDILARKK